MFVTAADCQNRLLDVLGGVSTNPTSLRDCRRAVQAAVREFFLAREWPSLRREFSLALSAVYSTGTVAVDSSTLVATLSGGSWPSWAEGQLLYAGGSLMRVSERTDSAHVKVSPFTPLASSIAPGTTYQLARDSYQLPLGIRRIGALRIGAARQHCTYLEPSLFDGYSSWTSFLQNFTLGCTTGYTIIVDGNGASWLRFGPYPSVADTAYGVGILGPPDISVWDETAGTVASTAASKVITGVGTSFSSSMADCVMRWRSGSRLDGHEGEYPPQQEFIVASVTNATSLTLASAATETISNGKYSISQRMPVDLATMAEALFACCVLHLHGLRKIDGEDRARIRYRTRLAIALSGITSNTDTAYAGDNFSW